MSVSNVERLEQSERLERSERFLLLRRPLLLASVLGCGVSMLTSGRFTLRLIVGATFSFGFVPLCECVPYAFVYRLHRCTGPFAQASDRYFAGNTPWLWWLVALMAAAAILPVRTTDLLSIALFTWLIPIALSVRY